MLHPRPPPSRRPEDGDNNTPSSGHASLNNSFNLSKTTKVSTLLNNQNNNQTQSLNTNTNSNLIQNQSSSLNSSLKSNKNFTNQQQNLNEQQNGNGNQTTGTTGTTVDDNNKVTTGAHNNNSQSTTTSQHKSSYSHSSTANTGSNHSTSGHHQTMSRRKRHTESQLRSVMNVTNNRLEAVEQMETESQQTNRALEQRVENLLLQNAELKRSLQTLQAGVVESMRGNKARVMGFGSSMKTANDNKSHYGHHVSDNSSTTRLPNLQDLDELRHIIERKREQINELEAKLDEARNFMQRQEQENTEKMARHGREIALWEERWENQLEKFAEAEEKIAKYEARISELESQNLKNETKITDFEQKIETLTTTQSELEQRNLELNKSLSEKTRHYSELEAISAKQILDLKNLLDAAIREKSQKSSQMLQLSAQALLNSTLSDSDALIKTAFREWKILTGNSRVEWERKQRFAIQEESAATIRKLEEELRLEREKNEAFKKDFLTTKQAEFDQTIEKLRQDLAQSQHAKEIAISRSTELETKTSALQKQLEQQKSLVQQGQTRIKSLESSNKQKDIQIKNLQSQLQTLSQTATAASAASEQQSKPEISSKPAVVPDDFKSKEEFYRKREETLLKEIKDYEEKVKTLESEKNSTNTTQSLNSTIRNLNMEKSENERKLKLKVKTMENQHNEEIKKLKSMIEELEEKLKLLESQLQGARNEVKEVEAQKNRAESERDAASNKLNSMKLNEISSNSNKRNNKNDVNSEASSPNESSSSSSGSSSNGGDSVRDDAKIKNNSSESQNSQNLSATEVAKLRREIAELQADRVELIKRTERLEGDNKSLATIRKMDADEYESKLKIADEKCMKWQSAVENNLIEVRKSLRMLVTAPKISINVGGNEFFVSANFPYETIKKSIQSEIIPKFQQCMHVSEQYGGDSDIKKLVYNAVEDLAKTLQNKVHELLPQAEGTCNWDGFGARGGGLIQGPTNSNSSVPNSISGSSLITPLKSHVNTPGTVGHTGGGTNNLNLMTTPSRGYGGRR